MKKIEITEYNSDWPIWFKQEALNLKSVLGNNCINIYHIGSTSVPGLCAKPKIDIIVEINSLSKSHSPLLSIDYEYRGEFNIPLRHFFRKKAPHDINLHVYEKDNPDINLNLSFRDYLLSSPEARAEYNILKQELIEVEESHKKNNSIFTGYNLGKDKFIRKILDKSRYNGLNFRFCTHNIEWNAYHNIAHNFFNSREIEYNPSHSNFSDSNYYHFILNKGSKIICIAELKWPKNSNPIIKYLTIDRLHKTQGLELYFKNLIAKWINSKK